MESIYVLEPGSYIKKEGAALKIVKDKVVIDKIPAGGLKKLMLVGYVSLSGPVLDFLIKKRVETVFISPTGRFKARLMIDEHKHVQLRKSQYLRLSNSLFALEVSKRIVEGKIANMTSMMLSRARKYDDNNLRVATVKMKAFGRGLGSATSLGSIRGIEGIATKEYFRKFPTFIKNDSFYFNGRNRRPPQDPVNALLSFVYTLLTNEVLSAIKAAGLDPYMGSLHEISYGRPSLACDLVEEYRTFLGDRFVLGLLNKKVIKVDDFIFRKTNQKNFSDEEEMKSKRPVEMKPGVCRTFIAAYEEMMNRKIYYKSSDKKISYRWLIFSQVRQFADYLNNSTKTYKTFTWS